jgi:hypothetical protein
MYSQHEVQWMDDKTFERAGVVVTVRKLPVARPKWSIEISTRTPRGDKGRFIPVHLHKEDGHLVVEEVDTDTMVDLVEEAEDYILQESCKVEALAQQSAP